MSMYVNQDEEEKVDEKSENVESRRSSTASTADKSESRRQSVAEKIGKKVCTHLHFNLFFHQIENIFIIIDSHLVNYQLILKGHKSETVFGICIHFAFVLNLIIILVVECL